MPDPRPSVPADHAAVPSTPPSIDTPAISQEPPQDEVDRLVAGWRSERPDLDVAPLTVLSRVTRLARHLDRARRSAFAEHDLEQWDFDVLATLRRAGPPYELSPGRLVTQLIVTSGTMTNRIDRLTKRGLVWRRPDPNDRRGVLVGLTDDGRRRADDALDSLLTREHELLAELAMDDRAELARLLRTLLLPFEAGPDEPLERDAPPVLGG